MSNDNVTPFPGHKRPTPDKVAIKQQRAQEERAREERRRWLSETLRRDQRLGPTDRISVALALNDLLVRIKHEYGFSSAKILGAAGYADRHKRQYAIPKESISQEEFARRLTLLRKKEGPYKRLSEGTKPYNKIVTAVAELTGRDLGDLQFEVFGQANFRSTAAQESDGEYEELTSRLRYVTGAISEKYELSRYFWDVENAGVAPIVVHKSGPRKKIAIKFTSEHKDTDGIPAQLFLGWPIEPGQFTSVCGSERFGGDLPAYPMVILGAWKLGNSFPVSVRGRRKLAEGWPFVVLSFCIVPTGKQRSATPVLRVDLCALVEGAPGTGWVWWVPLEPGKTTVGNHKINVRTVPNLPAPFTAGDIERHAAGNHWWRPDILFLPIDGTVCRNWFKFQPGESLYFSYDRSIPHPDLGPSLCERFGLDAPFSPFGADTLAGLVDAALWTGRLDQLLAEQAKHLTEAFKTTRKAAVEEREQSWETVKRRLENHENT